MPTVVATPIELGMERSTSRQVYHLPLAELGEFPVHLVLPCQRFILLLAADTESWVGDRFALATRMLKAGCAYFCAWGLGCESMHDVVDEAVLELGLFDEAKGTIMTTWHDKEPLSDAVHFALLSAEPDGIYREGCHAVILATVSNPAWSMIAKTTALPYLRKHAI